MRSRAAGGNGIQHYQFYCIFLFKAAAKLSFSWFMKLTAKFPPLPAAVTASYLSLHLSGMQWSSKKLWKHHSELRLLGCLKKNYSSETNFMVCVCVFLSSCTVFRMVRPTLWLSFLGSKYKNNWINKNEAWQHRCWINCPTALLLPLTLQTTDRRTHTNWFWRAFNYLLIKNYLLVGRINQSACTSICSFLSCHKSAVKNTVLTKSLHPES